MKYLSLTGDEMKLKNVSSSNVLTQCLRKGNSGLGTTRVRCTSIWETQNSAEPRNTVKNTSEAVSPSQAEFHYFSP